MRFVVSISMITALDIRGLVKRYTIGAGTCTARIEVLSGATLSLRAGEAAALVGDRGCGKSTLMLCAAGLLSHDAGDVRWFGDPSRSATRRVIYHVTRVDLMRAGCIGEPNVHLVDLARDVSDIELALWVDARRSAGDAVLVACRDDGWARALGARVVRMKRGRLADVDPRPLVRVAEKGWGS